MTNLSAWFAGRSLREKRLILVMAALAALTLVWAGIIRPVNDALSSARERQVDAASRLGDTRAEVEAVRASQALRGPVESGGVADLVRARADAAGFTLASLDVQGPDRVHVTVTSARPAALIPWLGRIERSGLLVESARLSDNGDRTVAVDLIIRAQGR